MAHAPTLGLPIHAPGMKIGIFGGSFDPPHEGHLMVSRLARARLGLDAVWWLVSPGNPLKAASPESSLTARMAAIRRLAPEPAVEVTGIEAEIGSRYTADTIGWLTERLPGIRLVWLMGADNLATFHLWRDWGAIASMVPMAVVDRPGATFRALSSPVATALRRFRMAERRAADLTGCAPPAWVFLHGRRLPVSSTALRAAAHPGRPAAQMS